MDSARGEIFGENGLVVQGFIMPLNDRMRFQNVEGSFRVAQRGNRLVRRDGTWQPADPIEQSSDHA